jgi:hypothetical protein
MRLLPQLLRVFEEVLRDALTSGRGVELLEDYRDSARRAGGEECGESRPEVASAEGDRVQDRGKVESGEAKERGGDRCKNGSESTVQVDGLGVSSEADVRRRVEDVRKVDRASEIAQAEVMEEGRVGTAEEAIGRRKGDELLEEGCAQIELTSNARVVVERFEGGKGGRGRERNVARPRAATHEEAELLDVSEREVDV